MSISFDINVDYLPVYSKMVLFIISNRQKNILRFLRVKRDEVLITNFSSKNLERDFLSRYKYMCSNR
jgi:hypothetical protein